VYSIEPKSVCAEDYQMIDDIVSKEVSKPTLGPSQSAHFEVLNKHLKDRFITATMSMNWNKLEDPRIPPNVEGFS